MSRTECQLEIRLPLTFPHLASRRRLASRPQNILTPSFTWLKRQCSSCKSIAKNGAHVVPDVIVVDVVGEDMLATVGREDAVGIGSDL